MEHERNVKRGGVASKTTELCMDMSPAFTKGAQEQFSNVSITFEKFHVIKAVNDAVDKARRNEQKSCKDLKNAQYIWLKNENNLTKNQKGNARSVKRLQLMVFSCSFSSYSNLINT